MFLSKKLLTVPKGSNNYTDVEGLILHSSVIFALLLSFAVAAQTAASGESMKEGDFFGLLCTSRDFRRFVVEETELADVGKPVAQTFNFNIPLGSGKVFNIREWLLITIEGDDRMPADTSPMPDALMACGKIPEMVVVFHSIVGVFPFRKMYAWFGYPQASQKDLVPRQHSLPSQYVRSWLAYGAAMFFLGLLITILLQLSLVLSPARKDQSGASFRSWSAIGYPVSLLNLLLLGMGTTFFMIGFNWYRYLSAMFDVSASAWVFFDVILILGLAPAITIDVAWLFGATWCSWSTATSPRTSESASELAKGRPKPMLETIEENCQKLFATAALV